MLKRIVDWAVLCPSKHPIAVESKERRLLQSGPVGFEAWVERAGPNGRVPDCYILKFMGIAGRAERETIHPAECWQDLAVEVWSINPPGYGGAGGRASLHTLAETAQGAYSAIQGEARGKPVLVTGNSLGTISALHLAARHDVRGILLRNPPPLRELIAEKHGWWNFGLSRLAARSVPDELCSIENATRASAPIVFVSSGKDRKVPRDFQQRIINAHQGENRVLILPEAGHACPIEKEQEAEYLALLAWLRGHLFRSGNSAPAASE